MNRACTVGLIAASAFVVGAAAASATIGAQWRIFAKGSDNSQYFSTASASADAPKSSELAVRAVGSSRKPIKLSFTLFCNGEREVRSGQVVAMTVAAAKKCNLSAYASLDGGGPVRVELLRR